MIGRRYWYGLHAITRDYPAFHRFDCVQCSSAHDPDFRHRVHHCYVCGRWLRWPTHWFRRGGYTSVTRHRLTNRG